MAVFSQDTWYMKMVHQSKDGDLSEYTTVEHLAKSILHGAADKFFLKLKSSYEFTFHAATFVASLGIVGTLEIKAKL